MTFRAAWIDFKDWLQRDHVNPWHVGMFYYDAKGQQTRLHASEHFTLLRDVVPHGTR